MGHTYSKNKVIPLNSCILCSTEVTNNYIRCVNCNILLHLRCYNEDASGEDVTSEVLPKLEDRYFICCKCGSYGSLNITINLRSLLK